MEDLQRELNAEKDERAKREALLEESVRELQEGSLAEEKTSESSNFDSVVYPLNCGQHDCTV